MTNKEWIFAKSSLEIGEMVDGCPPPFQSRPCAALNKLTCQECWAKWLDEEHEEPLKPCPFCGGKNITTVEAGCFPAFVQCAECNATVFADEDDDTIKIAIAKWNRRANDV